MTNGSYQIEIANRIGRLGTAVGTDYVVTQRPIGKTSILARFGNRIAAEAWIAERSSRSAIVTGARRIVVCGVCARCWSYGQSDDLEPATAAEGRRACERCGEPA